MGEIIELNSAKEISNTNVNIIVRDEKDLITITEDILLDTRTNISEVTAFNMPIAQLSTLGAAVASLLPALRTVTQTTTVNAQGLYQLANAGVGDVLKVAKNGNFWGAFKTAEGGSKFAQFKAAGPLSATNNTVMPIDPATIMMAVALFAIEQQLGSIAEIVKQIISFLEIEKESEVEADVQMLCNIISQYKFNWDNEHYVASNHKMVLDIQRTARKNMNSYQKLVTQVLNSNQLIVAQSKVNSTLQDLLKKFKYYKLSLYSFSLASLIEIMLSGNFKEEYIAGIKAGIESFSMDYRNIYTRCSEHLEKMTSASVEKNVLKGFGVASGAVGKFIGKIPVVEKSPIDEFLQNSGAHIKQSSDNMEKKTVASFAEVKDPATAIFIDKMQDLIRIYNHTTQVYFDDQKIYLVSG